MEFHKRPKMTTTSSANVEMSLEWTSTSAAERPLAVRVRFDIRFPRTRHHWTILRGRLAPLYATSNNPNDKWQLTTDKTTRVHILYPTSSFLVLFSDFAMKTNWNRRRVSPQPVEKVGVWTGFETGIAKHLLLALGCAIETTWEQYHSKSSHCIPNCDWRQRNRKSSQLTSHEWKSLEEHEGYCE